MTSEFSSINLNISNIATTMSKITVSATNGSIHQTLVSTNQSHLDTKIIPIFLKKGTWQLNINATSETTSEKQNALISLEVSTNHTVAVSVKLPQSTVAVDSVSVTPETARLYEHESLQLNVSILPDDACHIISWISSNPDVATVDQNGKVIAKKSGSVLISAISQENASKMDQSEITVLSDTSGINLELVEIPAGSFNMGSNRESPIHLVTVPAFKMGKFEITQSQYKAIMGTNPSCFYGLNKPVDSVSWRDAMEFCKKLTEKTGRIYILPSEAQWEYACRAGTTTPFNTGENLTTDQANYSGDYPYLKFPKGIRRGTTTPVGTFLPNAWGLYDMHGNVKEWCLDNWHPLYTGAPTDGTAWIDNNNTNHEVRGGCWSIRAEACLSAYRSDEQETEKNSTLGFRVVINQPSAKDKSIVSFKFDAPDVSGKISESNHSISVPFPSGTDLTALVPIIVYTGASISPKPGIAQNFSQPVKYTVTAGDGTSQTYTVTDTSFLDSINNSLSGTTWSYSTSKWNYYSSHSKDYTESKTTYTFYSDGTGIVNSYSNTTDYTYNIITKYWETSYSHSSNKFAFDYSAVSKTVIKLRYYTEDGIPSDTSNLTSLTSQTFYSELFKTTFTKD